MSAHSLVVTLRVRPGASRTRVGGRYGPDALCVAVSARAVDGAANEAVCAAIADAFAVRARAVELRHGHRGRTKVVAIEVADLRAARATLAELLTR